MAPFLLLILIITCVIMLIWGLSRPERVYQFPFLAGISYLGFIVPQAIGTIGNPDAVPRAVLNDGGLEKTLFMCILCAAMGFFGYLRPVQPRVGLAVRPRLDPDRLFLGGCILIGIALIGYTGLARLSGGYIEYFSVEGNYTLDWQGVVVMYGYLMNMIYPGVMCCLVSALLKPALGKWVVVAAACLLPLATIVFLGRRGRMVGFLMTWAIVLYFRTRWVPSRPMVVVVVCAGIVMLFAIPQYRNYTQIGGEWSKIKTVSPLEDFKKVLREGGSEFPGAVVIIQTYDRTGAFELGAGIYNTVVRCLVPRFIVGEKFKEDLQIQTREQDEMTRKYYGWVRPSYNYVTGPCDAFRQFWFFGALLYYFLGVYSRRIWVAAVEQDNVRAQIIHVWLVPMIMVTIVNGISYLAPAAVTFALAVGPVLWWAGKRRQPGMAVEGSVPVAEHRPAPWMARLGPINKGETCCGSTERGRPTAG